MLVSAATGYWLVYPGAPVIIQKMPWAEAITTLFFIGMIYPSIYPGQTRNPIPRKVLPCPMEFFFLIFDISFPTFLPLGPTMGRLVCFRYIHVLIDHP